MIDFIFILLFIPWIIGCFFVGAMGSRRRIGSFEAFLMAFFLSPIFGGIYVLSSPLNSDLEFQKRTIDLLSQIRNNTTARDTSDHLPDVSRD